MATLKQLLSWSSCGALMLSTAGCVGGQSASDVIRQNSVVISDSTEFPYNQQFMNEYFLKISNNTPEEIRLVDQALTLSSLDATELDNLLDLSSCNKIAANSECLLTVKLPGSNLKDGYFVFKLNYATTNENNTYEINKLIKYSAGGFESKEITLIGESKETIIQNADKFSLAVPFVLNKNFKDIGLELNGQALSMDNLHCATAGFSAGNSCTALIELHRGSAAPQLKINTIDEAGQIGSIRADFIYQYNNAAHLVYLKSPLLYPTSSAKSETVTVFNDGTAAANNLQFSLKPRNSADDANTTYDPNSSCISTKFLDPNKNCTLIYKNKTTPATMASWITQKIIYNNGISGVVPMSDDFTVYRTFQNYVKIEQTSLPLIANGNKFAVKASLVGDGNVTVSGNKIAAGNPFKHTTVASGNCALSSSSRTCTLELTPSGGTFPTTLTGFEVGAVELSATSGNDVFSIENPNVFYRAAPTENVKIDSNIPENMIFGLAAVPAEGYYIKAKLNSPAAESVVITATPNPADTSIANNAKCTINKGDKTCTFGQVTLASKVGKYGIGFSSSSNIYSIDANGKVEYNIIDVNKALLNVSYSKTISAGTGVKELKLNVPIIFAVDNTIAQENIVINRGDLTDTAVTQDAPCTILKDGSSCVHKLTINLDNFKELETPGGEVNIYIQWSVGNSYAFVDGARQKFTIKRIEANNEAVVVTDCSVIFSDSKGQRFEVAKNQRKIPLITGVNGVRQSLKKFPFDCKGSGSKAPWRPMRDVTEYKWWQKILHDIADVRNNVTLIPVGDYNNNSSEGRHSLFWTPEETLDPSKGWHYTGEITPGTHVDGWQFFGDFPTNWRGHPCPDTVNAVHAMWPIREI